MGDSLSYLDNLLSLRNTTSTQLHSYFTLFANTCKDTFHCFDTLQYSYSYFTLFPTLIKLLTSFTILVQLLYTIYDSNTTTLHCLQYVYTNFIYITPIQLHYAICKTEYRSFLDIFIVS